MELNKLIISIILILIGIKLFNYSYKFFIIYIAILLFVELISYVLIKNLRKSFQWLITPEDEFPELDKEGLKKFFKQGYDPELGWVRKPDTEKKEIGKFGVTAYHIDKNGSRKNPTHEKLPKKISFYGDSFIFGRQVNDNETFQWYLSNLTKSNVTNFSVGNYGLDQALLRLKREYSKNKTKVVVLGVVPSTIVRILDVWKHYNEFGNTFGFKPRFVIEKGKLKLIKNIIDTEGKFFKYKQYLNKIRKYDYFYKTKFQKEMIKFPYSISILSKPARNIPLILLVSWYKWLKKEKGLQIYPATMSIIMKVNLKLRYKLYKKNKYAVKLLTKIVEEFAKYSKENNFTPVFLFMPQKDDLLLIQKNKKSYYKETIKNIQKKLRTIDLTRDLINRNDLDDIYSDDNKYGGHYSKHGNKLIAEIIYKNLKENRII